jgi:hypothetical protein
MSIAIMPAPPVALSRRLVEARGPGQTSARRAISATPERLRRRVPGNQEDTPLRDDRGGWRVLPEVRSRKRRSSQCLVTLEPGFVGIARARRPGGRRGGHRRCPRERAAGRTPTGDRSCRSTRRGLLPPRWPAAPCRNGPSSGVAHPMGVSPSFLCNDGCARCADKCQRTRRRRCFQYPGRRFPWNTAMMTSVFVGWHVVDLETEALQEASSDAPLWRRPFPRSADLRELKGDRNRLIEVEDEGGAQARAKPLVVDDGVLVLLQRLAEESRAGALPRSPGPAMYAPSEDHNETKCFSGN